MEMCYIKLISNKGKYSYTTITVLIIGCVTEIRILTPIIVFNFSNNNTDLYFPNTMVLVLILNVLVFIF